MSALPEDLLACPRCDKTPLAATATAYRCAACRVDYPLVGGLPWLFADPQAALADWRSRLHGEAQRLRHEQHSLEQELGAGTLRASTASRVGRYRELLGRHARALAAVLEPLGAPGPAAAHETYLALRTRLPRDQGLQTYAANVHRDWAWGEAENRAALDTCRAVLGTDTALGDVLVPGSGAGRLAYDLFRALDCRTLTALDFNPLLAFVAARMFAGETLELVEFPLAPLGPEDDAVERVLSAPAPAAPGLFPVLGDVLRAPFPAGRFDTVVTPWLIDVVAEPLPDFAARMNRLLADGGRWVNFGSLAFTSPRRAERYTAGEVGEILDAAGFAPVQVRETRIPYMQSPASRHGRVETVFTFAATKQRPVDGPGRYRALPDWIVTGKVPVPLSAEFRTQAVTTQIYGFLMSLIDGKRSIEDMATVFEQQRLMPRDEAVPAIRNFLVRMHDDANAGD